MNTKFEVITESPERLAEKLIYIDSELTDRNDRTIWRSTLTAYCYATKDKAIAATVKKLKQEASK